MLITSNPPTPPTEKMDMSKKNLVEFLESLMAIQKKHDVYIDGDIEVSTRNGLFIGNLELNYNRLEIYHEETDTVLASYQETDDSDN